MKKIDDEKLRRSAEAFHGSGFLIIYMIIRTVWTLLRQLKEKEMNLQIDERKNTAYIKLSGLLSKEVIINALDLTISDKRYKKGMGRIWDIRDADLSFLDTKVIAELGQYSLKYPPGINNVKVAFVVGSDLGYGLCRMFEMLSQAKTPTHVFRAMDKAEKWMMEYYLAGEQLTMLIRPQANCYG